MGGFGALQLVLGALQFGVAAPAGGGGARQIVLHLGDFEHRQRLALAHAIAHVHVDVLYVARHLGVDVDLLKRAELGGNRQFAREIGGKRAGHRHAHGFRRIGIGFGPGAAPAGREQQQRNAHT